MYLIIIKALLMKDATNQSRYVDLHEKSIL
jgi:hypothetical protein